VAEACTIEAGWIFGREESSVCGFKTPGALAGDAHAKQPSQFIEAGGLVITKLRGTKGKFTRVQFRESFRTETGSQAREDGQKGEQLCTTVGVSVFFC